MRSDDEQVNEIEELREQLAAATDALHKTMNRVTKLVELLREPNWRLWTANAWLDWEARRCAFLAAQPAEPSANAHANCDPRDCATPLSEAEKLPACTGWAASWCPRCGECKCPRRPDGERIEDEADGCALHRDHSTHGG